MKYVKAQTKKKHMLKINYIPMKFMHILTFKNARTYIHTLGCYLNCTYFFSDFPSLKLHLQTDIEENI